MRAMLLDAIEKEKRDLLAHLEADPYGDRGQFLVVELADTDRLIRALLATTAARDHISPTKRGYWRAGDPPHTRSRSKRYLISRARLFGPGAES